MLPENEQELIELAKHDPAAFGTLYDRYVDRIYTFACRMVSDRVIAQDITASTFEKALAGINRYQWRGMPFVAWLYRIARNEVASHFRKERWLQPFENRNAGEINIEGDLIITQRFQDLQVAFTHLRRSDQEILTLRFIEGLSSGEVAQVLDCSAEQVYAKLHRALERLRKTMESGEESFRDEAYAGS